MAGAGDEWGALFREHFAPVWSYARRRCSSSAEADDVTAEVFATAWRRREDLPADAVRPWLRGVARRVLANRRRSAKRTDQLQQRLTGHASNRAPSNTDDVGLAEAIQTLPARDRDLLYLRYWDGMAIQDIAALVGCSPNAASLRLRRSRQRLARLLSMQPNDRGPSRTHDGKSQTEGGHKG